MAKLEQIEDLERSVQAYKAQAARVVSLEGNIQELINNGLLRYDEEGNCNSVTTWQEHEQLLA